MTAEEFLSRLEGVKRSGAGWVALCPAHEDTRHSLSVSEGEEGKVLVHCHAGCPQERILATLGLSLSALFPATSKEERVRRGVEAVYDYTDAAGELLFQVVRFEGKGFAQRQPFGSGHLWNLNGVTPVLYRLPSVLRAVEAGRPVWIVEGEKDVHTLERWKLVATTNAGGAGKWRAEYAADLDGAHVCILPDNDEPGRAHAAEVVRSVAMVARSVRLIALPGLPPKGDVTDWARAGGTKETLLRLARETPEWEPDTEEAAESEEPPAVHVNGRRPGGAETTRLIDVMREHVRWLWPGRIPLGKLTVIDGDPGLGKSTVTLDLAARVTTGREMPDGTRSELAGSRGVVIMTAEDGLGDTIRPRLEAVQADLQRITALQSILPISLNGELPVSEPPDVRNLAAIEEAIREVEAALVIVDPLMAFMPDDTNTGRDQQVRRILAPLGKLAESTGAAFLVVRHLNKTSSSSPIYRGGGSIGIIGAARSGLLVAKDPDDETERRIVLAVSKANLAAPVPALTYKIEPWEDTSMIEWGAASEHTARSLLAMPERDDKRTEAVQDAREWLRDLLADGPMVTNDVRIEAKAAGMPWRVVEDAATVERVQKRKQASTSFGKGPWEWALAEATNQPLGRENSTHVDSVSVSSVDCSDRHNSTPGEATNQPLDAGNSTCIDVARVSSVGRFAEMMVGDLLEYARSVGVTFRLEGDHLRIEGRGDLPDGLADALRSRSKGIALYLKEEATGGK